MSFIHATHYYRQVNCVRLYTVQVLLCPTYIDYTSRWDANRITASVVVVLLYSALLLFRFIVVIS